MTDDAVRFVDQRLASASATRKLLRYVFPEHWSFLLGEIALYAFAFLILTGIYLALFFDPDVGSRVAYSGPFHELDGTLVTPAYASTLRISSTVAGGLLVRQAHHWAAIVFIVAIVVHLLRVFFTGAFRNPREAIWMLGVLLLGAAILEGFLGYSLPDDLLSGMGLGIAYGVVLAIPFLGGSIGSTLWDGQYPGSGAIEGRLFVLHVVVLPVVMTLLLVGHLALVVRNHHTQFPGPGRTQRNTVGAPLWPGYALRSLALMGFVFAVLVLLGGLAQINPVWQWGPYELNVASNGAQPDWYLGWLIGALRLMPSFDVVVWGKTLIANPFWGGVLFPSVVFAVLLAYPWIERRLSRTPEPQHLLDRPRDRPWRTAFGVGFATWILAIFFAGSSDRAFYALGISYTSQVHVYRVVVLVLPIVAFAIALGVCRELRRTEARPLSGGPGRLVARRPDGSYEVIAQVPPEPRA